MREKSHNHQTQSLRKPNVLSCTLNINQLCNLCALTYSVCTVELIEQKPSTEMYDLCVYFFGLGLIKYNSAINFFGLLTFNLRSACLCIFMSMFLIFWIAYLSFSSSSVHFVKRLWRAIRHEQLNLHAAGINLLN